MKHKKVSALCILLCLFMLLLAACNTEIEGDSDSEMSTGYSGESVSDEGNDDDDITYYVDEQIELIIESDTFKEASVDERKDMVNELLTRLKKEDAIAHFSYFVDNYMFSFEYNNGVLGGVLTKDFGSEFDGEPIDTMNTSK